MSEELSALIPQRDKEKISTQLAELESCKKFTVTNDSEFQKLNGLMVYYKREKKIIEAMRVEAIKPYYPKYDYLSKFYNGIINKIKNFINNCDVGLGNYERAERIKRQAEQAKRDAEASEKRRKADEAARKEAEKVEQYKEEGRTEMAEKAEARVEKHIEQAETTVAAQVEETKLENTHFVEKYVATITDIKAAVEYCLSIPALGGCVNIDLKALERQQKAADGKWVIPGIKFDKQLKSRSRI